MPCHSTIARVEVEDLGLTNTKEIKDNPEKQDEQKRLKQRISGGFHGALLVHGGDQERGTLTQ